MDGSIVFARLRQFARFFRSMRANIPNDICIGSTVLSGLTIATDRQTDSPRYSVCNNRQHLRT